jgi:acetyl esterase/lipase
VLIVKKISVFAALVAAAALLSACAHSYDGYNFVSETVIYKTTDAGELKLDITVPGNAEKSPVFIYYHGGGWVSGDRSEFETAFGDLADTLRSRGFATVSADYTLADGERDSYACACDALDALNWVYENAGEYNIDREKIVVGGYSAGAQLALLAAYYNDDPEYDGDYGRNAHPVFCVDIAGPVFFNYRENDELHEKYGSEALDYYPQYVFDSDSGNYYDAMYFFNPSNVVTNDDTAGAMIIFGECDTVVPRQHSEDMYSTLCAYGLEVKMLEIGNMTHSFTPCDANKPLGLPLERVYKIIADSCEAAVGK